MSLLYDYELITELTLTALEWYREIKFTTEDFLLMKGQKALNVDEIEALSNWL